VSEAVTMPEETAVVTAARAGDEAAFAGLVERHRHPTATRIRIDVFARPRRRYGCESP